MTCYFGDIYKEDKDSDVYVMLDKNQIFLMDFLNYNVNLSLIDYFEIDTDKLTELLKL